MTTVTVSIRRVILVAYLALIVWLTAGAALGYPGV